MPKMFVVIETIGEYSDRDDRAILVCTDEERAKQHVLRLEALVRLRVAAAGRAYRVTDDGYYFYQEAEMDDDGAIVVPDAPEMKIAGWG